MDGCAPAAVVFHGRQECRPSGGWLLDLVSHSILGVDAEMSGLAEFFQQLRGLRLRGVLAEDGFQMAQERLLLFGAIGEGLAQAFEREGDEWVHGCGRGCLRFRRGGFGGMGKSQRGEIVMAAGLDVPASQVFHQGIEPLVFGHDVEIRRGVGDDGASDIVGEGEVERVLAGGGESDELDGRRMRHEFFHQADVQFRLFGSHEQCEINCFGPDDGGIHGVNILIVHEDVIHRRGEFGMGGHAGRGCWIVG